MSRFNVRPENALKRCEELIKVGMKEAALDVLHTVLSNKRNRTTWQKVHEKIILRYLDLAVELRKGRIAKDGLHQYKSICQQMAIGSLEVAIRHLVSLSEAKAQNARDQVSAAMEALADIDDLEEATESPETLMMSTVTPEAEKERKDRELLTPWLKFLWETYRTVLEILRNNNKLETLYQSIAQSAFMFCLKYQRKTELRRLGDMLRNHLQQIQKYSTNANAINLNAPESLQMHLETRFVQLSTATQLQLWQEAYRGIEDIHNLMTLSKKSPKPQMLAAYYTRLSEIFWRSDNRMVHAASLHKLYNLSINQNKNMSDEDKQMMARKLVVATLTIPVQRVKGKAEEYLETDPYNKRSRLTTLLGAVQAPTRKSLIAELIKVNVFAKAGDKFLELYKCLEVDFNPLLLCKRVEPILEEIGQDSELSVYLQALRESVLSRLLLQLSQVYATIKLEQITKLVKFFTVREIEYLIAKAVQNRELSAKIDHKTLSVTFESEAFCAQAPEMSEGPHIQVSRGEKMRGQLSNLAEALHTAIEKISEQSHRALSLNPNYYEQKAHAMQDIVKNAHQEHKRALERRVYIERNKERAEELAKEKERLDQKRKSEARRADIAAEQKRLVEESKRREEARAQREAETVKRASAIERMKELKTVMGSHSTVFDEVDIEDFAQMDAQEIVKKQVEFLDKEQQVMEQKLRAIARKLDHLERAKRQEELPLYAAQYEERKQEDLLAWQRVEEKKEADAFAKHQSDLETKARMLTIIGDIRGHADRVMSTCRAEFEASQAEFLEHVLRVREERIEDERLEQERLERERIEQEERVRREEEERRRFEEEERVRREEEEKRREQKRAEREAEMERLREIEEKKRVREEEIMARQQQQHVPSADRMQARGGPSWRDREQPQAPKWRSSRVEEQRPEGGSIFGGGGPRARDPRGAQVQGDRAFDGPRGGDYSRSDSGHGQSRFGGGTNVQGGGWRSRQQQQPDQRGDRDRMNGNRSEQSDRPPMRQASDGGQWRRGEAPPPRQQQQPPAQGGAPTRKREAPPAAAKASPSPEDKPPQQQDDDGFTTVTKSRR